MSDDLIFAMAEESRSEAIDPAGHTTDEKTLEELVHDLNQPLTAMTNFIAAAQVAITVGGTPETIAALLGDADAQAARARTVVRRMRALLER